MHRKLLTMHEGAREKGEAFAGGANRASVDPKMARTSSSPAHQFSTRFIAPRFANCAAC